MRFEQLLAGAADEAIALVQGSTQISYGALRQNVEALAQGLRQRGLQPGARVAVYLSKSIACVTIFYAIVRAGGICVPINPQLKAAQLRHIIEDSGAIFLFTSQMRASQVQAQQALPSGCTLLEVERDWADLCAATADPLEQMQEPQALAFILYTSGSTGRPKGVMLSHENLVLGAQSVADYLHIQADDHILALLPLSFDYGLNQIAIAAWRGARVILHEYLRARDVVRVIEKEKITCLAAVPPLWIQLLEADWPAEAGQSLRILTNSGGRMPVAVSAKLRTLFPHARLYLMYGLTEAFRSTYLDPDLVDTHPESIGKAIPHAEILVVKADGTRTQDGEVGELVHCGPLVGQGYWRDPQRTAERYKPAPPDSRYGGIAVWSGDQVIRDAQGLHYFVGRTDEMIKSLGNRISPTEVEEAAYASGTVGEVVAVGVADARMGEAIWLIATRAKGHDPQSAETLLKAYLATQLPGYMQPQKIIWREALPHNSNGKIDRAQLRQEYRSA